MTLTGLCAFPLTPADADGHVDTEGLARLVDRAVCGGVDSVCVLGSTGTYAYLDPVERKRAVSAAVEAVGGRVPVLAGVGALRTDTAIRCSADAISAGADALLLAPVSYTPLTEDEAYHHYRTVAEVAGRPLIIYNNPGTTHFQFSDRLVARLSKVSGIVRIKNPIPAEGDVASELDRLRPQLPAGFLVGYSGDWGCGRALLQGGDTWFSVLAGMLPAAALALSRAARAGDALEVARLDESLSPLWTLIRRHGGVRVMHSMLTFLPFGITPFQPPRPLLPLSSEVTAEVKSALAAL
ncbi:dihydrodipicolinate synthase family protein [Xanthomonas arboricola]|uniref:dihydrodipicolinate synthase family protein n=1 Tax=Xanthomonas arboricola TaxID=56448 RepID=UPI0004DA5866|nr:dihydrodipicolinate synthase family protein [Xanthomonas arboricola]KER79954.1 dihydrodipicolinate synthase [Xanthomonas arboricola pv. celebensis]